jgi:hypothetical protein
MVFGQTGRNPEFTQRPRPLLRRSEPHPLGRPPFERDARLADVEQRAELVHVAIAVCVQRLVRRQVERRARDLAREVRRVDEVVVAVDEDARALVRQHLREALDGDVGIVEVHRALDVQRVEARLAARVEDHGAREAREAHELVFGDPARFAMLRGLDRGAEVARAVDGRIGDPVAERQRGLKGDSEQRNDGESAHGGPPR